MAAVFARPRHHGKTLHNEHAAVVMTLGADEVKGAVGVRHWLEQADPSQARQSRSSVSMELSSDRAPLRRLLDLLAYALGQGNRLTTAAADSTLPNP